MAKHITIDHVNLIDYRMKLKRPYGTARGVTRGSKNFLVRLLAGGSESPTSGVGESQPRHKLTGDIDIDTAWQFANIAAAELVHKSINIDSHQSAIDDVRKIMATLNSLAFESAQEANQNKPFRGTLLGFEVALLDLAARSINIPVSQLLGEKRKDVAITVSTLSAQNSVEDVQKKLARQSRYPMVRVKGVGDFEKDAQLLRLIHKANTELENQKPIWMDLNEGFSESEAINFIEYIGEAILAGELPSVITLEQPIPGSLGSALSTLQAKADEILDGTDVGEIRIMPDESLWDISDLDKISTNGSCRAMNIKTAKAGGLLASLDLAREAVSRDSEAKICIGGMVGTSDITTWSLISLAKALPRVDYITAVPPGNVQQRISKPLTRFSSKTSNVHAPSNQPGIGGELDLEALNPYILRQEWYPEAPREVRAQEIELTLPSDSAEPNEAPSSTFSVLLLGDFHYGENYGTGGAKLIPQRGYAGGLQHLKTFIESADHVVANLETPLADADHYQSPFEGKKRFLHWSSPEQAPVALSSLGIDSVSLANNHTLDYGIAGLENTLEVLESQSISVLGAGKNLAEASRPLVIEVPDTAGGGTISVYGSMQRPSRESPVLDPFASDYESGCATIEDSIGSLTSGEDGSFFKIAFPHWGPNYKWRTTGQQRAADSLIGGGFDLVLGHGAHCMQEIERRPGGWAVYGIGNSHFQARGRFQQYVEENGIYPYSYWTVLRVHSFEDGSRRLKLALYPVYSDNRVTEFCPGPLSDADFATLLADFKSRGINLDLFSGFSIAGSKDSLGNHLLLNLGEYPVVSSQHEVRSADGVAEKSAVGDTSRIPTHKSRDSRALGHFVGRLLQKLRVRAGKKAGEADAGDVTPNVAVGDDHLGEYRAYSDSEAIRLLQEVENGRTLGTQLIADAATRDGAQVQWYGGATCVATQCNASVLLQGNRSLESAVGAGVIKDKYLTKTLLEEKGVGVPRGVLVGSADEAVDVMTRLSLPLVVKPQFGDRGKGVTVNITSEHDVREAFGRARIGTDKVLIEEHVDGDEFRCIVSPDNCVSVVRRIRPNVIGDGRSTVSELIAFKNNERRRNPNLFKRLILSDEVALKSLKRQNLGFDSVPSKGQLVVIREVGNVSGGADTQECSDSVSEEVKQHAMGVARAIPGLPWAGVDVLIDRATGDPYILEVNVNSGIGPHHFPMYGVPHNVADVISQQRISHASAFFEEVTSWGGPEIPEKDSSDNNSALSLNGPSRLSDEVHLALSRRPGLILGRLNKEILSVEVQGDLVEWLRGTASTKDLASVLSVLGRHGTIMALLKAANVPVVRGNRRVSGARAKAAWTGATQSVVVNPQLKPWRSSRQTQVASNKLQETMKSMPVATWYVQEKPRGMRLVIVATPLKSVLSLQSMHEPEVSSSLASAANDLAVRAVRAIPELRWAAVDVVLPDGLTATQENLVVEGLRRDFAIESGDRVVSGSIEQVADQIYSP